MVKLYTRQSLHTTTQLFQGCSGTRAKIWSNYTQDKIYILQHSYSQVAVELEPKFGHIIKISYSKVAVEQPRFGQSVYILQHSYSKAPGGTRATQNLSRYYNTATPRLKWNNSQFGQIIHKTKSAYYSYSQVAVEQSQNLVYYQGCTYYNTATPRLRWNKSQNLVKLYTRQICILQHSYSKAAVDTRAKIWSNYTQVYILQSLHTTQLKSGTRAKIWSNYALQHSYPRLHWN